MILFAFIARRYKRQDGIGAEEAWHITWGHSTSNQSNLGGFDTNCFRFWLTFGIDIIPYKSISHTHCQHPLTSEVRDRGHPRLTGMKWLMEEPPARVGLSQKGKLVFRPFRGSPLRPCMGHLEPRMGPLRPKIGPYRSSIDLKRYPGQ